MMRRTVGSNLAVAAMYLAFVAILVGAGRDDGGDMAGPLRLEFEHSEILASHDREALQAWRGGEQAVVRLLHTTGISGPFTLKPIRQARWQGAAAAGGETPMKIGPVDGHAVKLRVKPGDNGSVWDYALIPKNGQDIYDLRERLYERVHGKSGGDLPAETTTEAAPAEPPPPTDPVEAVVTRLQRARAALEASQKRATRIRAIEAAMGRVRGEIAELQEELGLFEEELLGLMTEAEADDRAVRIAAALAELEAALA